MASSEVVSQPDDEQEIGMQTELWLAIVQSAIVQSPNLVVGAVGAWFALARRAQHPRVSILGLIGFGCLLLSAFTFIGMQVWVQIQVAEGNGFRVSGLIANWNFVGIPLNLITLVTISIAVFIDRGSVDRAVRAREQPEAA